MNFKQQILSSLSSEEDAFAVSKALSVAALAEKYNSARYTDFYDPRLFSVVTAALKKAKTDYEAFGGYETAERRMLRIGADEYGSFPISAVLIKNNEAKYKGKQLSHRDVLGSVLGLGIKREVLGDIFTTDDGYTVISKSEMADFIKDNLCRIGRYSVSCEKLDLSDIRLPNRSYIYLKGTVASARLDSIVSLVTGKSRSAAAGLIAAGLVKINYFPKTSQTFMVADGDVIAIKGFGKANIRLGGESRKGRIFVTAEKYN